MVRIRENFVILTGAPGSGKTTLLEYLRTQGLPIVAEPARAILAEQRSVEGKGVPEKDARLFVDLMLSRMMYQYGQQETATASVLFDRGVPDMIAYASLFGFDYPPGWKAAQQYRYNQRVFFAPSWEQIYTTDTERKMSFALAQQFGETLRMVYTQAGYTLVEIPCCSVEERAQFILDSL